MLDGGFAQVLPLVEHADELLAAAGLDADSAVEISSANLGVVLGPGESEEYLALLTELTERHSVDSFWADPDGAQADGIEKVQIVAPERRARGDRRECPRLRAAHSRSSGSLHRAVNAGAGLS